MRACYKYKACILVPLLLTACATREPLTHDPSLNEGNASTIMVYRPNTSFRKMEMDKPFVYLDGKVLDRLSVNRQLMARVSPGEHEVVIKNRCCSCPPTMSGGRA